MTTRDKRDIRFRIIAGIVVLLVVVLALFVFVDQNSRRIQELNTRYTESSAQELNGRIDDLFNESNKGIATTATVFENVLSSSYISFDDVANLSSESVFDSLVFVGADGIVLNAVGEKNDVSDREYFINGMQGRDGVAAVSNSAMSGLSSMLVFYRPVYYDGAVIGVLAGVYNQETLSEMLDLSFFGKESVALLVRDDGAIVASSKAAKIEESSVFELFSQNASQISIGEKVTVDEATHKQFQNALLNGDSYSFTYESEAGTGTAYVSKVGIRNFRTVVVFPASISSEMISSFNGTGLMLVGIIVVAFVAYIIALIIVTRRQNAKIAKQKEMPDKIVRATTDLFQRFIIIDFDTQTCRYVKQEDKSNDLPVVGNYETFYQFILDNTHDEDDRERLSKMFEIENLRTILSKSDTVVSFEYKGSAEGKEGTWYQGSIIALSWDKGGRLNGALIALRDITASKQYELESREALQHAFRAAENASRAKSDFLNSMSHDIRTPMNSIIGLTALASMNVDDPSRVTECLSKINMSSKHLLGLINEVLDMAKIESGSVSLNTEDFDLPETIESLMTIIQPQIALKQQNLRVELGNMQHEQVVGDPMRLQQIFLNIIGNAVKFTPEGGDIIFGIEEVPSRVSGCGCYVFTFTDTGCGMDEDLLEHVFEPFVRSGDLRTSKIEGTGLGLPIVKTLVDMMNGEITVDSTLGVGTTFTVTLHLKLRKVDSEDVSRLEGLPVLVADDEEDAARSACAMLKSIGMDAEYVLGGKEAVCRVIDAYNAAHDYIAVILDWKMPDLSGVETAREIRKYVPSEIPIIILSAYDWSTIEEEARAAGVDAFIAKPLFRSRLVRVMRELVLKEVEQPRPTQTDALESCDFENKRFLYVEDNELAAEIGIELLSITGAAIEHVSNGQEAVDAIIGHEPGYYDVVLMDVQMPIMNGYEATRAIRAAGADPSTGRPDLASVPIIAQTADAFVEDVNKALEAGMNAHLAKPLDLEALARTLSEFIS